MGARRSFTLSLPAGDPASAEIWALIDAISAEGGDAGRELRRRIVEAGQVAPRLGALEQHMARVLALLEAGQVATPGLLAPPAPSAPALGRDEVDSMLDFG